MYIQIIKQAIKTFISSEEVKIAFGYIKKITYVLFLSLPITIFWGEYKYDNGYEDAKIEVERAYKEKEAQRKQELQVISDLIIRKTKDYMQQVIERQQVETVYLDRIVEKPVYINQCIEQEGIEYLNNKAGRKAAKK